MSVPLRVGSFARRRGRSVLWRVAIYGAVPALLLVVWPIAGAGVALPGSPDIAPVHSSERATLERSIAEARAAIRGRRISD